MTATAPVDAGEEYHIRIEDVGREGDGIGYIDGFVIIVPGAELGDSVAIEIEDVHESHAVANIREKLD